MALFKIQKGLATNLKANRPYTNEGWAYFTTDDGKFYIDIVGDGTNLYPAYDSNEHLTGRRICLNAAKADYVGNSLTIKFNNGSTENTNKYTFDGSNAKTFNITTKGNGISITSSAGKIEFSNTGVTEIKGAGDAIYQTGSVSLTPLNIIGSTVIGGPTIPIYWNGSSFAPVTIQSSVTMTIRRWAASGA